jgi:sugar phosphate isomerase/epimerase
MLTRREFVQNATAGLAAMAVAPRGYAKKADRPVGVQLYTVRSVLQNDVPGTLAAIRKIGYRTVETYVAEYKMSAQDLRRAILNAGLVAPSAHFGYNDFGTRFDYAKELGVECVVCSSVPGNLANSSDGFKQAAEQYNQWGSQAKNAGLKFGFHNHNIEFREFDGKTGIDILLGNTDPALVQWQMDCYWVAQSGHDPVEMLRKHGKRMQSLHLKDRKADATVTLSTGPGSAFFTEVGEGTLNWPAIFREAVRFNIPNMYVEQDQTDKPPLESLQISYTNIEKYLSAV